MCPGDGIKLDKITHATCSMYSLHLDVLELHSFYNNKQSSILKLFTCSSKLSNPRRDPWLPPIHSQLVKSISNNLGLPEISGGAGDGLHRTEPLTSGSGSYRWIDDRTGLSCWKSAGVGDLLDVVGTLSSLTLETDLRTEKVTLRNQLSRIQQRVSVIFIKFFTTIMHYFSNKKLEKTLINDESHFLAACQNERHENHPD